MTNCEDTNDVVHHLKFQAALDEAVCEEAAFHAFEEHFEASAEDPYFEDLLRTWLTAWRKALAYITKQPVREVCIRLNGIGEGGPYPVVNGVCVLPQSVAENLVASTVGQQMKRELLAQWASYKQPTAPSGEAVDEWVLVPRKPTQAMLEAFNDWRPTEGNNYAGGQSVSAQARWEFRQRYAALLAAAPQQPATVDGMVMAQASDLKILAEFADRGMRGNPAKLAALRAKAILAAQQQGGRDHG